MEDSQFLYTCCTPPALGGGRPAPHLFVASPPHTHLEMGPSRPLYFYIQWKNSGKINPSATPGRSPHPLPLQPACLPPCIVILTSLSLSPFPPYLTFLPCLLLLVRGRLLQNHEWSDTGCLRRLLGPHRHAHWHLTACGRPTQEKLCVYVYACGWPGRWEIYGEENFPYFLITGQASNLISLRHAPTPTQFFSLHPKDTPFAWLFSVLHTTPENDSDLHTFAGESL